MTTSSSHANNARRQVGEYLVKQAGYSKKSARDFYKQGDDILVCVSFQRGRGITDVHIGIVPLYMPDSIHTLNGVHLTTLFPDCVLFEDDSAQQAELWAERVIKHLNSGILTFMESIASPRALLDYLKNRSVFDQRFVKAPNQVDELIIFSSAYLGKVSYAVRYAKAEQKKIKKERIDNLAKKVAHWDKEIEKARAALAKSSSERKKDLEGLITTYERDKQIATLDAEHNAPYTIQRYNQWMEPLVDPEININEFFLHMIEHNKECLEYEKLFSRRSTVPKNK